MQWGPIILAARVFSLPFVCGKPVLPSVCVGVQLLAAQKPVNRPGWWKEKFALFQMPATWRVVDI